MQPLSTTQTLWTYEDYCKIPEDGKRHEIINGIHHVSPAPFVPHQRILGRLFKSLYDHVEKHQVGEVFVAPVDVLLSPNDVVQPDILYISNDRASILSDKNAQGAPDLIIEILSNSTRRHDEVTKLELYERFGVLEYWIVDRKSESIKIYRLRDDSFDKPIVLSRTGGDTIETTLLPGWQMDLEDVFRKK